MPAIDITGHHPATDALLPEAGGNGAVVLAPAIEGGAAFADVLGRRLDPARLPTITLDEMISSLAGGGPGLLGVDRLGLLGAMPGTAAPRSGTAPVLVDTVGASGQSATGPGAQVLTAGERYLGVPYKWGGTDPSTGFDCSGFVQQVYADLGVRLPRVSIDQSRAGTAVPSMAQARPGDLVFWHGNGRRANHIGIYAGNGQFLHAPRSGEVVRYQDLADRRPPDAIRRVIT